MTRLSTTMAMFGATVALLLSGCGSSSGPSGMGTTLLQAGAACTLADVKACGMAGSASAVLVCSGGAWQPLDVCATGTLCKGDFTTGTPTYACAAGTTTDTTETDSATPDTTSDATPIDTAGPDVPVTPDVAIDVAPDAPETAEDVVDPVKTLQQLQNVKTACPEPPPAFDNFLMDVLVKDVVVTSPLRTASGFEGLFVQDQGGGPWSGIYLMMKGSATTLAGLKPGDVISVLGDAKEYYCFTELQADTVETSGATQAPVAVTVTPQQIAEAAALDAVEPYESVLVRLENVYVADPLANGSDGKPHGEILVGDDASSPTVRLGGGFGLFYLTNYDKTTKVYSEKYPKGTKFASVTGVLEFSFGKFKLLPIEEPVIAE